MSRANVVNFALAIFGVSAGAMVTAVIGLVTDPSHHTFWVGLFVCATIITIVAGTVAPIGALGDKAEAAELERTKKMVPLVGMIACGVGLIGFSGWYFWPISRQAQQPSVAASSQSAATSHRGAQHVAAVMPSPAVTSGHMRSTIPESAGNVRDLFSFSHLAWTVVETLDGWDLSEVAVNVFNSADIPVQWRVERFQLLVDNNVVGGVGVGKWGDASPHSGQYMTFPVQPASKISAATRTVDVIFILQYKRRDGEIFITKRHLSREIGSLKPLEYRERVVEDDAG